MDVEDVLRRGWAATAASSAVWDDERWRAISARVVQLLRDAGASAGLPIALPALGVVSAWAGDFATAASLAEERERGDGDREPDPRCMAY